MKLLDIEKNDKEFGELPGYKKFSITWKNNCAHVILSSQYKTKPQNGRWCLENLLDFSLDKDELKVLADNINKLLKNKQRSNT